jgi:uncharacterized protein
LSKFKAYNLGIIFLVTFGMSKAAPIEFEHSKLIIGTAKGSHEFNVEVAKTLEQMTQGLMFRDSMPPDGGMLFLFERNRKITMWMKDTILSLDIIFINSDGVVVHVSEKTTPLLLESISSIEMARSVLEVQAGTAERLMIRPGDRVSSDAMTQLKD